MRIILMYGIGIDGNVNLSVGIRSTIGMNSQWKMPTVVKLPKLKLQSFVSLFLLIVLRVEMRDVSTWRTQSGLKTIASMQLNAILSFSTQTALAGACLCV